MTRRFLRCQQHIRFKISATCAFTATQRCALLQELSTFCLGSNAATQASAATQRHANASTANQRHALLQQLSDVRFCSNSATLSAISASASAQFRHPFSTASASASVSASTSALLQPQPQCEFCSSLNAFQLQPQRDISGSAASVQHQFFKLRALTETN